MDSLTLTSVYTYAMITICADSWNSRSVLWPMMFFGAAKFPCPRANRSLKIPVNFFSQLIVLEKTSRGFPRATQHSVLRGGGVRPFAAWIAVVGRPVVVLVVIRAIAVTLVIRIALVAVRTARAVVSVPLGKRKITFQSEGKKCPRRERNGGREEREK